MKVKIRYATASDIEGIISLCNECFDESSNLDEAKEIYAKYKNDANQIYIVRDLNGTIIAHAKITIIPTIYEDFGIFAIVNHVCVKKEYRRVGIATNMLDVIVEICKSKGCSSIKLWSDNVREGAQLCYLKYGFKVANNKFFNLTI